jgi:PKD repeat protein
MARLSFTRFVTFAALCAAGLAPVAASAQSTTPGTAQTRFQAGPQGKVISCATASACAVGTARPSAAAKAAVTGKTDLRSRIATIALSQIGEATTPAETSFNGIDCDPYSTLDAATSPNADGCGPDATYRVENQNEAWCSDFAKWVWAQAGITADMNTLNAGANSFYAWALDQGQTPVADSGTPEPGDAVAFYKPGPITTSTYADHVGLITSVNADGTVDMANGDFLGPNGITVEYNQNLDLSTWPSTVWSAGEQYVIVTPPTAAQQPTPHASVTGPTSAVAGTTVDFSAQASEPGGTISQYYWTFNDGRTNNTTGQQVSHVFQRAGLYTVTMTATSSFGTVTTKTWNIGVSAGPSAISSVPNNAVWYTTDPVMQYEFTRGSNGALAADSWDGAAWLQQDEPGSPAAGSPITGLAYSDEDAGYAIAPHAYYRTTSGSLGETYRGTSGWASATLPGDPAAQSAIQALATNRSSLDVTLSVYFFDASGHLNATTETDGTWSTSALGHGLLPATSSPGSLAVTSGYVFYLDSAGRLVQATDQGRALPRITTNVLGVRPGSALSAATTDAGIDVYFIDAAGNLADAHASTSGAWTVHEIPGGPADNSSLTANGNEVFYLTGSGTPGVTSWNGSSWQSATLPGTASSIVGATSDQLFLTDGRGLALDTSGSTGWTSSILPNTPTAYPGTVLLYAATPADDATALAAASSAGLPAGQVTTDFEAAWAAAVSGDYLVIAVGQGASAALFDNPCGWANPSQADPGSTPFSDVKQPVNTPLTNLFAAILSGCRKRP